MSLDLDALEAQARAQIAAIDVMYEIDRGVGGLPEDHFEAYRAWQSVSAGSYSHADTVLALIERLRAAEARPTPPADDVREALYSMLRWGVEDDEMGLVDRIVTRFEVRPRGTVTDAVTIRNIICSTCGRKAYVYPDGHGYHSSDQPAAPVGTPYHEPTEVNPGEALTFEQYIEGTE